MKKLMNELTDEHNMSIIMWIPDLEPLSSAAPSLCGPSVPSEEGSTGCSRKGTGDSSLQGPRGILAQGAEHRAQGWMDPCPGWDCSSL